MSLTDIDQQDAQDMTRLAQGHGPALNDLMQRHAGRLHGYLFRSLQDEADAADLVQETFVRVYQNRQKFRTAQKFSTWLYAIASNLVRDRYRWRQRHPQVSLDTGQIEGHQDWLATAAPSPGTPAATLEAKETGEAVRKALAALPDELRQPLILAVYQELPQAEIAAILNCSVKAVETRIYRARQQLKKTLANYITSP